MKTKNNIGEATFEAKPEDIKILKATNAIGKEDTVKVLDKNELSAPVQEDTIPKVSNKIKYLSNVKDNKTGKISEPFTIADKNYQMVRGITPNKEVVMGVYCLDEVDESGENIIHPVDHFEKHFVKKENKVSEVASDNSKDFVSKEIKHLVNDKGYPQKRAVGAAFSIAKDKGYKVEEEKIKETPLDKKKESLNPFNLSEYKHFLVDSKTGKFRKFKTDEDLAKSKMTNDECYMRINELKKFFEQTIFGSKKKKEISEETPANTPQSEDDLKGKANILMQHISTKISPNEIESIKQNPLAQKEVILAFSNLIGVPPNYIPKIMAGLKADVKTTDQTTTTTPPVTNGVNETTNGRKLIKTIKIKDMVNEK